MGFSVFRMSGRKFYYVQWSDPETGEVKTRSTKQTEIGDAHQWLGAHKHELLYGVPREAIERVAWAVVKDEFVERTMKGRAESTIRRNKSAMRKFESCVVFEFLDEINDRLIEKFTDKMYQEGLSEYTIRTNLMIIHKVLEWAVRKNKMVSVPYFEFPGDLPEIRGRAITQEEFERMIKKIPDVVGDAGKDSWEFLLNGLWWGGLRISEAMLLHWTDPTDIMADFSGEYPMFAFQPHAQKNRKMQHTPMAPEFADHISKQRRKGFVFNPARRTRPYHLRMTADHVGKIISEIGEEAKVVVSKRDGEVKYASAHDLRRSFGDRWSWKVAENELKELMRHKSITTTYKFYAKRNASRSAKKIWDFFTNTSTNTSRNGSKSEHSGQAG